LNNTLDVEFDVSSSEESDDDGVSVFKTRINFRHKYEIYKNIEKIYDLICL